MGKTLLIVGAVIIIIVIIIFVVKSVNSKKEAELQMQMQPQQAPQLGDTIGTLLGTLINKGVENKQSGLSVFGNEKKPKYSTDSSGYIKGDGWINLGE